MPSPCLGVGARVLQKCPHTNCCHNSSERFGDSPSVGNINPAWLNYRMWDSPAHWHRCGLPAATALSPMHPPRGHSRAPLSRNLSVQPPSPPRRSSCPNPATFPWPTPMQRFTPRPLSLLTRGRKEGGGRMSSSGTPTGRWDQAKLLTLARIACPHANPIPLSPLCPLVLLPHVPMQGNSSFCCHVWVGA